METKDRTQASYNLVDINEQARIAFEKCKETKEQKIERLKKAYLQIEQIKDEIFKRKMIVEDRINHFETMQERIGIYENKNFPTPLSVSKTELEDLNEKWFKLIDESMKIRQELKELEDDLRRE